MRELAFGLPLDVDDDLSGCPHNLGLMPVRVSSIRFAGQKGSNEMASG